MPLFYPDRTLRRQSPLLLLSRKAGRPNCGGAQVYSSTRLRERKLHMLSWKLLARRSRSRIVAKDPSGLSDELLKQGPTGSFRLGNVASRTSSQSRLDRLEVPHGIPSSTDLLGRRYRASPVQPRVEARLLRRSVTGKSLILSDRSPPSTWQAFALKFLEPSGLDSAPVPSNSCGYHLRKK